MVRKLSKRHSCKAQGRHQMRHNISQEKSQRDVSKPPADNTNICNSYPRYPFYQGNGFLGRHTLSVESLKDRISPKIFYERELHPMPTSKKSGWNSGGLCPFHTDKNPGSFFVHSHTGGLVIAFNLIEMINFFLKSLISFY
jgi:hypothetical protein